MNKQKISGSKDKTRNIHSIWEVSYLLYKGISFTKTEMLYGKVVFIFPDTFEVQRHLQEFVLNPAVKIQEYISLFQRVKNTIYLEKEKYGKARVGKYMAEVNG